MTTYFTPINRDCRWMPSVIALDTLPKAPYTVYAMLAIFMGNILVKASLCLGDTGKELTFPSRTSFLFLKNQLCNLVQLFEYTGRSVDVAVRSEKFLR